MLQETVQTEISAQASTERAGYLSLYNQQGIDDIIIYNPGNTPRREEELALFNFASSISSDSFSFQDQVLAQFYRIWAKSRGANAADPRERYELASAVLNSPLPAKQLEGTWGIQGSTMNVLRRDLVAATVVVMRDVYGLSGTYYLTKSQFEQYEKLSKLEVTSKQIHAIRQDENISICLSRVPNVEWLLDCYSKYHTLHPLLEGVGLNYPKSEIGRLNESLLNFIQSNVETDGAKKAHNVYKLARTITIASWLNQKQYSRDISASLSKAIHLLITQDSTRTPDNERLVWNINALLPLIGIDGKTAQTDHEHSLINDSIRQLAKAYVNGSTIEELAVAIRAGKPDVSLKYLKEQLGKLFSLIEKVILFSQDGSDITNNWLRENFIYDRTLAINRLFQEIRRFNIDNL